ncbi:hypothetical protein CMUS01_14033 [Colletotrichum musicola]|uniref:Uncharacterized protein n=1 Tax=Colletotrichum musicola TaxID=2175873 RepID=A0A8H6J784_9PEZI|nr:hypothetical protein CMUS01_14033 [Colletotrichum musicola]
MSICHRSRLGMASHLAASAVRHGPGGAEAYTTEMSLMARVDDETTNGRAFASAAYWRARTPIRDSTAALSPQVSGLTLDRSPRANAGRR